MGEHLPEDKLIDCVQQFPELYDRRHPNYYLKSARNQIWQNISIELGIEAEECQKKWKILREKYVKELKKSNRSKTVTYPVDWDLMDRLEFLRDNIAPKRKHSETVDKSETFSNADEQRIDSAHEETQGDRDETFDAALQAFTNTANLLQSNLNDIQEERYSVEGRFANLVEASLIELPDDGRDEAMEKMFSVLMEVKRKYKRRRSE